MFHSGFAEGVSVIDGVSSQEEETLASQELEYFGDSDYEDDQACRPHLWLVKLTH